MSPAKTSPLQVEVKGASEVMEKLAKVVSAKTTQQALDGLGIALLNKATLVAPVDQGNAGGAPDRKKRAGGRTKGSLKKGAAGNIWREGGKAGLIIGTEVHEGTTYYPAVLDKPPSGIEYHYRTGPFAGQSLTGWFTNIGDRSEADLLKATMAIRDGMVKQWGR